MLDEWARRVLNYGHAEEVVILLPEAGAKPSK
jgi:hypothetical protein